MNGTEEERKENARTVAAIDIGANSVRMEVAEVLPDGDIEVLERMAKATYLGHDSFRRQSLSPKTMRAVLNILREFQRTIQVYGCAPVRAVATSAIREASNRFLFLDRVSMSVGFDVEVIDVSEESRLTVSAVRQSMGAELAKGRGLTLIAEVGGGNTVLTVLQEGEIEASQSVPLGSIRLQEALSTSNDPPEQVAEIMQNQISNVISTIQTTLPLKRVTKFIATGGDVRFAANQVGKSMRGSDLKQVTREDFDRLVRRCVKCTPEVLARKFGLPFSKVDTLNPALLVYQTLLRATKARKMIVSDVSMRDGLLLDLARGVMGQEDPAFAEGVLHSAMAIARKFHTDMSHAQQVAGLSVRLFDVLAKEHGLGGRHRLLLEAAGLLHEIGGLVSSRGHHKHSYYLISNAEIFGLSREELQTVAHVARYHRRSGPKPSHVDYMSLPRHQRMAVNKLAALLRVADALDRGHAQQVSAFAAEIKKEDLVLSIPGVNDLTLERRAVAAKGDLFEEIYGLGIRLEESAGMLIEDHRAEAVE